MKDKHLIFFDEATTVTDADLAKVGEILDRQAEKLAGGGMSYGLAAMGRTITGRKVDHSKAFISLAHLHQGKPFADVFAKAMGDAVHSGLGVIEIDSLSQLEEQVTAQAIRAQRGRSKSGINQLIWHMWDAVYVHTVKHDLKQLQYAQTRTSQGSSDPLFAAMELHNERIRLGKKAIKEMFHAKPLNLNQHTTGPLKAKDWE